MSLIVPCYNEKKTLPEVVDAIIRLQSPNLDVEIIIVDDFSADGSYETACALSHKYSNVVVCRHECNKGKGAALRTGFMKASGDFIGIQDADLEYNPLDYLKMLRMILDGHADVVLGSRYLLREGRLVLRWWHSTMNRILTMFSNMLSDIYLTDMETCYKLFTRDIICEIAPALKENRFGFEPEVIARLARGAKVAGWKIREVAIDYTPRTFSAGKKIGWKDGLRALWCIIKYNLQN